MFLQALLLTEAHGFFSRCPQQDVIHHISQHIEDAVFVIRNNMFHKDNFSSSLKLVMNTQISTSETSYRITLVPISDTTSRYWRTLQKNIKVTMETCVNDVSHRQPIDVLHLSEGLDSDRGRTRQIWGYHGSDCHQNSRFYWNFGGYRCNIWRDRN
ncbi:hypothetical protein CDAR_398721 [Caerostris darwini]|uniref:Uncharacterized protein n=1 Tax=Caerostris darwini TaxID=1538125 RepID=A0AAV4SY13_9ARAC|nr:hypothetical protein CDAR_398721 [Caerostris darwini]